MKSSTNKLNQAIERMTTGVKINHAKDNAANYAISIDMTTKIGSLDVAEENVLMGLDLISTAESVLQEIEDKLERLRTLQEQACNGAYGEESKRVINTECNSIVDEINRLYSTTEYNGVKLFQAPVTTYSGGGPLVEQEVVATASTTFADLGISDTTIDIYNSANVKEETIAISATLSIGEFFDLIEPKGFNTRISNGQITIESASGKYLAGVLADELGISTQEYTYIESTTTTFDPNFEVVTTTTTTTTDYVTTTTSATQTNTVWATTTTSETQTNTVEITTTIDIINTITVDIVTTTTVSQSEELNTENYFLTNPITYTDSEILAFSRVADVSNFTAGSTYSITTTEELGKLAERVRFGQTCAGVTFVLGANLDLSTVPMWSPIGMDGCAFEGVFDGNGHTISNLDITDHQGSKGLFGYTNGAIIKNVGIKDADLFISAGQSSGILVGVAKGGTIINCYTSGTISGYSNVGGLVGSCSSVKVENCYSTATVIGSDYVAGYIGGLIGSFSDGEILKCYAKGNVTAVAGPAGGLIGGASLSNIITDSFATGNVRTDTDEAGGLIGRISSNDVSIYISNCYSIGNIDGYCVGGLVARVLGDVDNLILENCYSNGTLTGTTLATSFSVSDDWRGTNYTYIEAPTIIKATETTTFEELGLDMELDIRNQNGVTLVDINKEMTLLEVINALNLITGYSATLDNGILSITTSGLAPIDTESRFFSFIPVTSSTTTSTSSVIQTETVQQEETTTNIEIITISITTTSSSTETETIWTTTTTETTKTETTYTTNDIIATGSITFEELGVSTSLRVTVISNGTTSRLDITKDTTLDDFYLSLESKGFEIIETAGLVTIKGDGNTYISSQNLQNLLGLSALSKTNGVRKENTKSDKQTYIVFVNSSSIPGRVPIHIGTSTVPDSQIQIDMSFSLDDVENMRDIALDTTTDFLSQIDGMLALVAKKQIFLGTAANRLESVLEEITIKRDNLISSLSTIRDADIADVSTLYIQQQILQQASATLLATANQSPAIALQLI